MRRRERTQAEAMQRRLRKTFYQRNRLLFVLGIVLVMALGSVNLLISYQLQVIVDLVSGGTMEALWDVCGKSALIVLLLVVGLVSKREVLPRFLRRAAGQYKQSIFAQMLGKSISSFQTESSGQYLSALTNDVISIETNYLSQLFFLIMQGELFVGALVMMLWYSPLLTLISILLSLLPVAASVFCGSRLAREETAVSAQNDAFVSTVKDILGGFTVIKSFRAEGEIQKLFQSADGRLEQAKYRRRKTAELIDALGAVAGTLAQVGVFLFGAYLAVTGRGVTPGMVVIFLQLMNFIVGPIASVPPILAGRKASLGLIQKLSRVLAANVRRDGDRTLTGLRDGIVLEHVSFAYEPEHMILRDISLRLEAGKRYAVVGGSGSGKSTLLSLLMGGCDDYRGRICYDGVEQRALRAQSLYELVSIVQQSVFVFDSTIQENITLFRAFDPAAVAAAVEQSGLSDLLAERGADYRCGENGSGLSGGERQRISIARCLLRRSPVLLVDEATAALDAETAYAVTDAILHMQGVTRVVVTHRLEDALMRQYDEIVVLKNGRICEQGSFDDLMARRGQFFALYTVGNEASHATA